MSNTGTRASLLASYRKQFANYTLTELGAWPVRLYQLRKPGYGGMEGVDVLIMGGGQVPERIVVTGDLAPNDNQGCVSNIGYGLDWFAGRKSDDYLCGKFLRREWVPEIARAALKGRLEEEQRDEDDEDLDKDDRAAATTRIEAIGEALDAAADPGGADPTRSAEAFHELWTELYDDGPEDTGFGYGPRSAALLVAIQETFARLYWDKREAEEQAKSAAVVEATIGPDTGVASDPTRVAQGAP